MKACALFIYGDKYKYLPSLTSSKASASLLYKDLSEHSSTYIPKWVLLEPPIPLQNSDDMINIFNEFEKKIHFYNCDVSFIYISGHGYSVKDGDIFIYSNNSKPRSIETGLKITRIVSILCNRNIGHLVICLDLCRVSQANVSFKTNFITELKKYSTNYSSLIILTSAGESEVSYGGLKNKPSPFSLGLVKMLSDEYITTPILYFENLLRKVLTNEYLNTKLKYSEPEFIPIPKTDKRNIFGYYISKSLNKHFEISSFQYIDTFVDVIIDREQKSFKSDPYISSYTEIIPLPIYLRGQEVRIEDLILENNNPIIIEGESGSGKTICAKNISYFIATEYKQQKIKKLAIYFNAGYLNKFSDNSLSSIEILQKYLEEGRYFVKLKEIISFFNDFKLILLVDGIEDLKNRTLLITFLKECNTIINANYIIFCQPYDKGWIQNKIGLKFIELGRITPIAIKKIEKFDKKLYNRIDKSNKKELLPLELQLLKRYIINNTHKLPTIKQILDYEYETTIARIKKIVDSKMHLSHNKQENLKRKIIELFRKFALSLREFEQFQFFKTDDGEILFNKTITTLKLFELNFLEFIELGIRANIFIQDKNSVRYTHRAVQELLIAYDWKISKISKNYLIEKSTSTIWESIITTYLILLDKNDSILNDIMSTNPFLLVDCINRGFELSDKKIDKLIESILNVSSHWTRNETATTLTKLPWEISENLIKTYRAEKKFDKKTSIAIALGRFDNDKSYKFLLYEYENLLTSKGDNNLLYLRRRILDVLKNKYNLSKITHWFDLNPDIAIKEWARIIRSVRIESADDLDELALFISNNFYDSELLLLDAILSSKKQKYLSSLNIVDHENKIHLCNKLIKLIELNTQERLYRCIPALIIEELKLAEMAETLYKALTTEKDIYAVGEIIYVLGTISEKKMMTKIYIFLSQYLKTHEFQMLENNAKNGFYNDLKQGVIQAIHNNCFGYDIPIDFLPINIIQTIKNELSLQKEKSSTIYE